MLQPYQPLKQQDENLARMQQRVKSAFDRVTPMVILDGVLVQNVSLSSAAATLVKHGLGRAAVGWIVVDIQGAATVYRVRQGTIPADVLPLQASSNVVCSLWVF